MMGLAMIDPWVMGFWCSKTSYVTWEMLGFIVIDFSNRWK